MTAALSAYVVLVVLALSVTLPRHLRARSGGLAASERRRWAATEPAWQSLLAQVRADRAVAGRS